MKANSKKLRASVLAGLLTVALVLTGTFAWRSISQETRNELMDESNPGGRVHDDFKGLENKDIYAENFTDEDMGALVFVRIKLSEYMETGAEAGVNRNDPARQAKAILDTAAGQTYASINDTDTWKVYNPADGDAPFREYWDLTFGGSTIYMPTFNKNKDSLAVDVNGTYVGVDGDFETGDPYDDYVTYTVGQKVGPKDASYDNDGTVVQETHEAKATLTSQPGFLLMSQWVKAGKPVCNQWVYDDTADVADGGGWFYWPEPILPQTATGLLLDKVTQRKSVGEKSYYAIGVTGQFATAKDWGDEAGKTDADKGFYLNGFSATAKELMDQAASVEVGKNGKWYLPQGNNVYREILDDAGKLGELVCAGSDGLIGTTDDRTDVVYVKDGFTMEGTKYCEYYLKPTAAEPYYRAALPTGKLGVDTDTRFWVISGEVPTGTLTTRPVTSLVIRAKDNADQVKRNTTTPVTLQFIPTVTVATGVSDASVLWSVSGNTDPKTAISDGLLSVGTDESAGTELTVTATSKLDRRVSDSVTITVVNDITTTLDNKEYYVLKIDSANNRALVLAKELQDQRRMDPEDTAHWPQSELFHWLNDAGATGWLGKNPDLNGVALTTLVRTRADHNATTWEDSISKVFLLSQADISGKLTAADAQASDYTAGGILDAPTGGWVGKLDGTAIDWWLRSPFYASHSAGYVDTTGNISGNHSRSAAWGIRPAAWVMLNGVTVATENNTAGLLPGNTLQCTATVVENMRPAGNQDVTWSVSGGGSGTSIDPNTGLLTVAAGETARAVTVTARTPDGTLAGSREVLVGNLITLDGIPFFVLKQESGQALVLSVNVLENRQMDAVDETHWPVSDLHDYLNSSDPGGWLYDKPEIRERVIPTTVRTRKDFSSTEFETDNNCKIFFLSESDITGNFNGNTSAVRDFDYTAGGKLTAPGASWIGTLNGVAVDWWLRSPIFRSDTVSYITPGGGLGNHGRAGSYGVRPALWVKTS